MASPNSQRITRILVADDLERDNPSLPSNALKFASELAQSLGAEICLLHTYRMPELAVPTQSAALIEGPYLQQLTRVLDEESGAIARLRPGVHIAYAVEKGDPVERILSDVRSMGCQLVVVGTHARHGVKRAVLGSVAEEVIRRSPVPVISVNPGSHVRFPAHPHSIVAALDFSEGSAEQTALEAARFAQAYEARLELLTVIEEWVYPVVQSASLLAGGFVMPLERDLIELANLRTTQLEELQRRVLAETAVETRIKVIERAASVGGAICQAARDAGAGLLVVGHRPASRLSYALLGSVSRLVLREADCPVLVVPPRTLRAVK